MKKAKNTHTYTTSVTETLPPGRFLEAGEIVQEGDLVCYADEKARLCPALVDIKVLVGGWTFYRPEPKKKKSKPKYRFLEAGETIRKTDQYNWADGGQKPHWQKTCASWKIVSEEAGEGQFYRRRRHVKTS